MKYLILVLSNPHFLERWEGLTEAQREAFGRDHLALTEELAASGELVVSEGLADPALAKRVTVRDGKTMTTDGPFAEVKEHLAGLLPRRLRVRGTGGGDRRAGARRRMGSGRGAAGARHEQPRPVTVPRRVETCCASSRRRYSASSCAATASSTRARTRCRRRCSPPRSAGRTDGLPANPQGWLITAANRRLVDVWRNESARRRRELADAALAPPEPAPVPGQDDTLTLLVLCCHPSLAPPSQVALTLRAVGGLTTAEIARGLLVPEATVAQRISRAKARIKASGAQFGEPSDAERAERLPAVLRVLYLIFNEGYTASSGTALHRVELTREALRLTRALHAGLPEDGEVAGLLALMLLTDARRPARTAARRLAGATRRAGPHPVGPRRHRRGHRRWSPPRWRPRSPGPTSCRPRSPPCTPRPTGPRTPTGARSSGCTTCSPRSRPARWSR